MFMNLEDIRTFYQEKEMKEFGIEYIKKKFSNYLF